MFSVHTWKCINEREQERNGHAFAAEIDERIKWMRILAMGNEMANGRL